MTKCEPAIRNPRSAVVWLAFAATTLCVYFLGLTMPLVGPDEPRYAQVAREMFERGDWITPTLGGFNWFEKPALLYWLQIASYNVFGVSEFAARFGSALFGLGTIASLWLLGRNIERYATNNHQRSTNDFANWLALIGASTVGIVAFAHGASFDIILTFPITAALISYFLYDLRRRTGYLLGFYFFIGVALLAKGLVGILFPFAIVLLYHLLAWKRPAWSFVGSLFWGTLLAAAVASTWYLPMYMRHGYEFIDQFFVQHHFQRYTSNKYLHPQPFYFFFWVLPLMTIPWMPFFIASVWSASKRIISGDEAGSATGNDSAEPVVDAIVPRSLLLFALAWLTVPLVFFSFSGSKLPGYILPAVPAAIILTTYQVYGVIQGTLMRSYIVQAVAAGTFAVVLIAVVAFAPGFAETDSVKGFFAEANGRGLGELPVLMLHGTSHNAEFYASGRIVRQADGRPKRLSGPPEVLGEIRQRDGRPVLVLVPLEYLQQLLDGDSLTAEVIKSNGEWVLVRVEQSQF